MPKYLFKARYTAEGAKGILAEGGSGRRAAVEKSVASVGGKVEVFYFAFGAEDAYIICDFPDDISAAGMAIAVGASGRVGSTTVKLLTCEDIDNAVKKPVAFRPPGG